MVIEGGQKSEAGHESNTEKSTMLNCPVCSRGFDDLSRLNDHLDSDHGFGEPEELTVHSVKKQTKGNNKKKKIAPEHLKPFEAGSSRCHECNEYLRKEIGVVNCHRCGELFCKTHCRNIMKVDTQGRYDPRKGRWCLCCYKCFNERPGYNDFGSVRDRTETLKSLRTARNEDKQLQILQLEHRLVRLINGIISITREHEGSLLEGLRVKKDVSRLERTITPWRDDDESKDCFICKQHFDITLRRHHCRLCGNIVCDSRSTNCSNQVPIRNLMNAASDLTFIGSINDVAADDISVRLCSNCTHNLFFQRKFTKDIRQPLTPLLSQCERICNTSRVIVNVLLQLTESFDKIGPSKQTSEPPTQAEIDEATKLRAKLLRAVASYNQLTAQVFKFNPSNNAERKIQQSIRMASSLFIDEKLVQLKSLPSTKPPPKMHAPESEDQQVVKLSDFIVNNLTIKEIKEIKQFREELMVLKEQAFLVENMMENAKRQRNFDEINTLKGNLQEIGSRIRTLQEYLGDQSFV